MKNIHNLSSTTSSREHSTIYQLTRTYDIFSVSLDHGQAYLPNNKGLLPKLKPTAVAEYKEIHAAVWPGVLAALERAHIVDYSIHHYPPLQLLIATFKYTGDNYEGDMAKVAQDPETQRWWNVTDAMQESFEEGAEGSGKEMPWWTSLEEVFRFEGKA